MPRKKDGMKYELLPRPTKGEDGKPMLYARPAIGFKYDIRSLDNFCNKYRGLPPGELSRIFEVFIDVAAFLMRDGSRVETPMGSFAPRLKLDGDYTEPSQIKSKNVSFAGVEFIPSKHFETSVNDKIIHGFVRKREVVERHPLSDPADLENALQKSLQSGFTTVNRFCRYSDLRYHTAKRYLNSLCEGENPRLRKFKEGRNLHYYPIAKADNK